MIVLAKLWGVTGVVNKETQVFTPREWTESEAARYAADRGQEQLIADEEFVRSRLV